MGKKSAKRVKRAWAASRGGGNEQAVARDGIGWHLPPIANAL